MHIARTIEKEWGRERERDKERERDTEKERNKEREWERKSMMKIYNSLNPKK